MSKKHRNTLRQKVLATRDNLSSIERREKSIAISSRLMGVPEVTVAQIVLIYMHFRSEVQTSEIIGQMFAANQIVTIPYTCSDISQLIAVKVTNLEQQVTLGYCGIPEPRPELIENSSCDPATIDLVIIPGSVFDKYGGRLGYGGGYYDRLLSNEAPGAVRIGIAFELQLVDRVPVEPHDQFMDFVVTEKNLYDCRSNRHA
jgi:5-formyltetrahydrofolate cyclo-ligase